MPRYRRGLPQKSGDLFLTDGGLETTLAFHDGIDLPAFAAFVLLETDDGRERLRQYYRQYADIARRRELGFILESPTWRASRDWGEKLGYSGERLAAINRTGIALLEEIRREYDATVPHVVISGCLGPRGDGYTTDRSMSPEAAAAYHREQIATFRDTDADMVTAMTIPYAAEAIGIAEASRSESLPVVISFTVETNGHLPSGESLQEAIEQVDAVTGGIPEYYMVNCAHPDHFSRALGAGPWRDRIQAIRANASRKSHAELDEATVLDDGNPVELGSQYRTLASSLPNLNVLGGCCGTDHRHIAAICEAFCGPLSPKSSPGGA